MAAAAQAVHDYFKKDGKNIVYIDVMNNMSVDCDCDGAPIPPNSRTSESSPPSDWGV